MCGSTDPFRTRLIAVIGRSPPEIVDAIHLHRPVVDLGRMQALLQLRVMLIPFLHEVVDLNCTIPHSLDLFKK